jgi:hypothetical protein
VAVKNPAVKILAVKKVVFGALIRERPVPYSIAGRMAISRKDRVQTKG